MSVSYRPSDNGGGVGFLGLLGILFIGLRLAGIIDWPWWMVLLPIYGPILLATAIVLIAYAMSRLP